MTKRGPMQLFWRMSHEARASILAAVAAIARLAPASARISVLFRLPGTQ